MHSPGAGISSTGIRDPCSFRTELGKHKQGLQKCGWQRSWLSKRGRGLTVTESSVLCASVCVCALCTEHSFVLAPRQLSESKSMGNSLKNHLEHSSLQRITSARTNREQHLARTVAELFMPQTRDCFSWDEEGESLWKKYWYGRTYPEQFEVQHKLFLLTCATSSGKPSWGRSGEGRNYAVTKMEHTHKQCSFLNELAM